MKVQPIIQGVAHRPDTRWLRGGEDVGSSEHHKVSKASVLVASCMAVAKCQQEAIGGRI